MKIFDLLKSDNQGIWIEKMKTCDWGAGGWLIALLEEGSVERTFGNGTKVLILTVDDEVASFCTLAPMDEIDDKTMTPWVGFVYTYPEHRGHRYSGALIERAKELAKDDGHSKLYISSEEVGLYEKYGFTFLEHRQSIHGYMTGIFVCELK